MAKRRVTRRVKLGDVGSTDRSKRSLAMKKGWATRKRKAAAAKRRATMQAKKAQKEIDAIREDILKHQEHKINRPYDTSPAAVRVSVTGDGGGGGVSSTTTSPKALRPTWITRDGVVLFMDEMEEGHLRNAIAFLTRRIQARLGSTVWMSEMTEKMRHLVQLLDEAKRRNLKV